MTPVPAARSKTLRPAHTLSLALALLLGACSGDGSDTPSGPVVNSLPAVSTAAQGGSQADRADVDAFMQKAIVDQQVPGATLVVMHDGQVVYMKAYGYADVGRAVAVHPEDRFDIGSMSKQFVAAAVLLLNEDGLVDLDAPIAQYLGPSGPPQWGQITVREVLSHTAGLEPFPSQAFFDHIEDAGATTEDAMLASFRADPLIAAPGTLWSYSNVGYDLLGILISRVTGHFYGDFIQTRIFTPLGMSTARFIDPSHGDAGMALPYQVAGGRWVYTPLDAANQRYLSTGASGIQMSVLDLARWDAALDAGTLLSPASQALMWTPAGTITVPQYDLGDAYGFGWFLGTGASGQHVVDHSGGMPGYTTDILRDLDGRWSVGVFTNLDEAGSSDPQGVGRHVLALFGDAI